MWRLFMRTLLLLSLLQYAATDSEVPEIPIEDCPSNKVCAIFVKYERCKVNGVLAGEVEQEITGYVWEDKASCDRPEYDRRQYARLDIEPVSLRNWSFVVTLWERREGDAVKNEDPHIYNIGFDFGSAKLIFPSVNETKFAWRKGADAEWQWSSHALKYEREFRAKGFTFASYSFDIASDEKLAHHFGKKKFTFERYVDTSEHTTHALNDQRFVDLLDKLSPCDHDELAKMRACHGGCEALRVSNETVDVSCAKNASFWFHNKDDAIFARHWQEADEIKCALGNYRASWQGGYQELLPSFEVQCALEMPTKLNGLGLGLMLGGAGLFLVIVLVIVGYFVWRCKKRRDDTRSHSVTFSTPSTPGRFMMSSRRK